MNDVKCNCKTCQITVYTAKEDLNSIKNISSFCNTCSNNQILNQIAEILIVEFRLGVNGSVNTELSVKFNPPTDSTSITTRPIQSTTTIPASCGVSKIQPSTVQARIIGGLEIIN